MSKMLGYLIKPVENDDFLSKRITKIAHEAEVELKMHARPRWRWEAEAEVQPLIKGGGVWPPSNGDAYKGGGSGGPDFHLRLGLRWLSTAKHKHSQAQAQPSTAALGCACAWLRLGWLRLSLRLESCALRLESCACACAWDACAWPALELGCACAWLRLRLLCA